jgi:nitroimidazol reductase NimA-like FMN-containing flavoprotein (pyridoxamine 5'-phosphate oxidase superfamily)
VFFTFANKKIDSMRRNDKEIKDPEVIREIFINASVCRLGLPTDGLPYIVPVNFAWAKGIIYFHSAAKGRKMTLLQKHPRISFEMELSGEIIRDPEACNWTTKYRSLMGTATPSIITDAEEKKKAMDLIMKKYGATIDLNYKKSVFSRIVIVALKVESVSAKQGGDW